MVYTCIDIRCIGCELQVLEDHPGWPAYNEVQYNTYSDITKAFQTGMTQAQIEGYLSVLANNTEVSTKTRV